MLSYEMALGVQFAENSCGEILGRWRGYGGEGGGRARGTTGSEPRFAAILRDN
jgi:hypothetical protein